MGRGEVVLAGIADLVKDAFELAGFVPLFIFYEEVPLLVGISDLLFVTKKACCNCPVAREFLGHI